VRDEFVHRFGRGGDEVLDDPASDRSLGKSGEEDAGSYDDLLRFPILGAALAELKVKGDFALGVVNLLRLTDGFVGASRLYLNRIMVAHIETHAVDLPAGRHHGAS
jgi:hypothetical protein